MPICPVARCKLIRLVFLALPLLDWFRPWQYRLRVGVRVLVPGSHQDERYYLQKIKAVIEAMHANVAQRSWLESRHYSMLFLVETNSRKAKLEALLRKEVYPLRPEFRVELAPSPLTLKEFLDGELLD